MRFTRIVRMLTVPCAMALALAVAQPAFADEPGQANGTFTITFSPTSARTADGNTFIDYTFTEVMVGDFIGTRTGSGEAVFHADGTINTTNSGVFVGSIDGMSGTADIRYSGTGTFAAAAGNFTMTSGTGGLTGVHAVGHDSGSATGPTSLAGNYSFLVHVGSA